MNETIERRNKNVKKEIRMSIVSWIAFLGCGTSSVGAKDIPDSPNFDIIVARATGRFSMSISAHTIRSADTPFPLESGETVTISATYTPSNASVDFGLYGPDGVFRYIPINNGVISRTIRIEQRGNYTFAIRNNSSQPIHVSGYVNY